VEPFQYSSDRVTTDLKQVLHRDFTVGRCECLYGEIVDSVFSLHLGFKF